ncbi:SHOCT domain-containing protein [Candidatus Pelagibacter sp.]|nr:SHOCT domain-containing protein [Candidatus Pelagibacter sp.]
MEKIIFFGLVIPIIGFVLYLGATAIMKGFNAKENNRSEKEEDIISTGSTSDKNQISNEITKLNELRQSGVLTEEEFEKAKKRLLND